ncbi:MAG TPA: YbjN domain-containing protein [Candidatus Ozemobacteraceae bacterium]|nr:YbjN domain-containing protein [Candidatus Ozemobacteraceae bacterium]
MKPEQPEMPQTAPQVTAWEVGTIKTVAAFLTDEGYRFQYVNEACLELYLQGKNLTMRMIIYAHNRHLVVRVPGFIRNVELRRLDVMLAVLRLMDEYFDIRFELAKDGRSLSAACTHILEDGALTKNQCMQCLMVVAYIIDDCYPSLMQLVYGGKAPEAAPEILETPASEPESGPPGGGEDDDGDEGPEEPSDEGGTGESPSGRRARSTRHTKIN